MSLTRFFREPLVHFVAIGAALFLFFQWGGGGSGPTSHRIVLTAGQIEHLAASFAQTWQRPPVETELKGLIDDWVREEIAAREAMAMGLDRDDTIIRRRLRQKLEFLMEDDAAATPPTEADLQAWLDAHAAVYAVEPEISLCQVYVSVDRRGAAAEADAARLLAELRTLGPDAAVETLGDPLMLPQDLERISTGEIGRTFGEEFAQGVMAAPVGRWSGPVRSGFGLHLVLVRERTAARQPALDEVRPAVERDVLADRRRRQLAATYEALVAKYTVVIERPAAADRATP
jgi:hypothetical protein